MFLTLISKRLGIKYNKYLIAGVYGAIYAILFFIILLLSSLYLKKINFFMISLISVFLGVCMFIAGLIKEEVFKWSKK